MSIIQDKQKIVTAMMQVVRATEAFNAQDLAWIEIILNRHDSQNGIEQCRNFVLRCDDFLDKKEALEKKERETGRSCLMKLELEKVQLHQQLYAIKSLYYRQKKILIGVAQRKRHPTQTVPNLGGFIAPQAYRCEVETVFGLGYAESREYLADKAIETNCTHILFVDDDILLPLKGLEALIQCNERFVGLNYYKRNPNLESVVTSVGPDPSVVFHNYIVEAKQGDLAPIPANAMGLGATLIELELFKSMPKPWFQFIHEELPGGKKGRLLIGEDSALVQRLLANGVTPKIIPGMCALHVDFASGKHYGPEFLVDPIKRKVRPEFEEHYCKFSCPTQELVAPDNDTVFSGNNK